MPVPDSSVNFYDSTAAMMEASGAQASGGMVPVESVKRVLAETMDNALQLILNTAVEPQHRHLTSATATTTVIVTVKPAICEVGGEAGMTGIPWGGDSEALNFGTYPRAIAYTAALVWLFCGIAVAADLFMESIEAITSSRKMVTIEIVDANGERQAKHVTHKVWNSTIANLTLMALGSSAPEILLSVVELFGNDFKSGELGPSTIVGSAAFNLMVIIGVCVMSIPAGEIRKVESVDPYCVTAFFSVFAYLWLIVILTMTSPDEVTLAEAVITFMFFPLLAVLAYAADIGYVKPTVLLLALFGDGHSADSDEDSIRTKAAEKADQEVLLIKKLINDTGVLEELTGESPEDAANYVLHFFTRQGHHFEELKPSEIFDVIVQMRLRHDEDSHVDLTPHDHNAANASHQEAKSTLKGKRRSRAELRMEATKMLTAKSLNPRTIQASMMRERLALSKNIDVVMSEGGKTLVQDFHKAAAEKGESVSVIDKSKFANKTIIFKHPPTFVPHRHQETEFQKKILFEMGAATDFVIVPAGRRMKVKIPVTRQIHLGSTHMGVPQQNFEAQLVSSVQVTSEAYGYGAWMKELHKKPVEFRKNTDRYNGKVQMLEVKLDGSQSVGQYVDLFFDRAQIWVDDNEPLERQPEEEWDDDNDDRWNSVYDGAAQGEGEAHYALEDGEEEEHNNYDEEQPEGEGDYEQDAGGAPEDYDGAESGEHPEHEVEAEPEYAEGAHEMHAVVEVGDVELVSTSSWGSSTKHGAAARGHLRGSGAARSSTSRHGRTSTSTNQNKAPRQKQMLKQQYYYESNAHRAVDNKHLPTRERTSHHIADDEVIQHDIPCLAVVNHHPVCRVYVVPEEEYAFRSGEVLFCEEQMIVPGSKHEQDVMTYALRVHGNAGSCKVSYHTEKGSGLPGTDYEPVDGETLEFEEGETIVECKLGIKGRHPHDSTPDYFYVVMDKIELTSRDWELPWPTFDADADGGEDANVMTVYVLPDGDPNLWRAGHGILGMLDHCCDVGQILTGKNEWANQFLEAFYVGGDPQAAEHADGGAVVLHYVMLPWKLLMAFSPPSMLFGGWLSFVTILIIIGVMTAFVADVASVFGCVVGVEDSITAITFVALGTSVPDLFASMSAAKEQENADDAVGNVTGSNSVNVFLGLGLPMLIGAIYHEYLKDLTGYAELGADNKATGVVDYSRNPDGSARTTVFDKQDGLDVLQYPAGALTFSVMTFTITAILSLYHLYQRRCQYGGELGGPKAAQISSGTYLISLWAFYIGLSIWRVKNGDETKTWEEVVAFPLGFVHLAILLFLVNTTVACFADTSEADDAKEVANVDEGKRHALLLAAKAHERRKADRKMNKIMELLGGSAEDQESLSNYSQKPVPKPRKKESKDTSPPKRISTQPTFTKKNATSKTQLMTKTAKQTKKKAREE
ncbi:unnamed protein product [Amoebophrya sp. A120]|nr:unnamed protein product [Amoebophrya sp. A120]|eukprot:GSA120T00020243001.1